MLVAGDNLAGKRLDAALAAILPKMGLRGRRRAILGGHVLVNGKKEAPSRKVRGGDELIFLESPEKAPESAGDARFLQKQGDYLFFYKPAGLHSAALAGSPQISLESILPGLLANAGLKIRGKARPLQRLDRQTSGIVCAALTEKAENFFRQAEKEGACRKHYLALLAGGLREPVAAKNRLLCAKRKKTAISSLSAPPDRHTFILPLRHFTRDNSDLPLEQDECATLALCRICRGQRHQIRAHAAAIGHPLLGDSLYGDSSGAPFRLEHFHISFPGRDCLYFAENSLARLVPEPLENIYANILK